MSEGFPGRERQLPLNPDVTRNLAESVRIYESLPRDDIRRRGALHHVFILMELIPPDLSVEEVDIMTQHVRDKAYEKFIVQNVIPEDDVPNRAERMGYSFAYLLGLHALQSSDLTSAANAHYYLARHNNFFAMQRGEKLRLKIDRHDQEEVS